MFPCKFVRARAHGFGLATRARFEFHTDGRGHLFREISRLGGEVKNAISGSEFPGAVSRRWTRVDTPRTLINNRWT